MSQDVEHVVVEDVKKPVLVVVSEQVQTMTTPKKPTNYTVAFITGSGTGGGTPGAQQILNEHLANGWIYVGTVMENGLIFARWD